MQACSYPSILYAVTRYHSCVVKWGVKKLIVPIVVLLAFSMLITSVSAPVQEYFAVRFYGSANGTCWVITEFGGETPDYKGSGRICVSGLAIGTEYHPDYYLAYTVWTLITIMRVSWTNGSAHAQLMVHMRFWYHPTLCKGLLNDTSNEFIIQYMKFSGYYIADTAAPRQPRHLRQKIRGIATVQFVLDPTIGIPAPGLAAKVWLQIPSDGTHPHWLTFMWISEQYGDYTPARVFSRERPRQFPMFY